MNRVAKIALLLLGLGLVGYGIYFQTNIESGKSSWENSLLNAARQQQFSSEFSRYVASVKSGWTVVISAGIAIVLAACFIKTRPKQ